MSNKNFTSSSLERWSMHHRYGYLGDWLPLVIEPPFSSSSFPWLGRNFGHFSSHWVLTLGRRCADVADQGQYSLELPTDILIPRLLISHGSRAIPTIYGQNQNYKSRYLGPPLTQVYALRVPSLHIYLYNACALLTEGAWWLWSHRLPPVIWRHPQNFRCPNEGFGY